MKQLLTVVVVVLWIGFAAVTGVYVASLTHDAVTGVIYGIVSLVAPVVPIGLDVFFRSGILFTGTCGLGWVVLATHVTGSVLVGMGLGWGYFVAVALVLVFLVIGVYCADQYKKGTTKN